LVEQLIECFGFSRIIKVVEDKFGVYAAGDDEGSNAGSGLVRLRRAKIKELF
jgi:hypothetical protein